jgi:hypothetical protein
MLHQLTEDTAYCLPSPASGRGEPSLWERILDLVEGDLAERRGRETFVEARDEAGSPCRKEIGDLTAEERRGLDPALKGSVAERLLDRYLAEQGCVDLVEKRRTYTKKVGVLTPEDLPALIEADRWRIEEERERAEFVRDARSDLEQLPVAEYRTGYLPLSGRAASLMAALNRGR